jgi:hypothetical protein
MTGQTADSLADWCQDSGEVTVLTMAGFWADIGIALSSCRGNWADCAPDDPRVDDPR